MTEHVVAREAFRLLRRDVLKYTPNVLGLYGLSLVAGNDKGRLARNTYFLFRNLDDILDGDREDLKGIETPVAYAHNYRRQIDSGEYDPTDPISHLLQQALEGYASLSQDQERHKQNFKDIIDAMLLEQELAQKRTIMSETQLRRYHEVLFSPIIDLAFTGLGSHMSSATVPEFWEALGRTYSVRDLEEDWNRGIINIPAEVLNAAGLTSEAPYGDVMGNPVIQRWIQDEMNLSNELLCSFRDRLQHLERPEPFFARFLCRNRIKRMQRVIDRHRDPMFPSRSRNRNG